MYARIGHGDPDVGTWAQLVASGQEFGEIAPSSTASTSGDTVARPHSYATQYVVAGGAQLGRARVSLTDRFRAIRGTTFNSPSARAGIDGEFLSASVFGEQRGEDSTRTLDASARFTPLRFLSLLGAMGRYSATSGSVRPDASTLRAEVGLRLRGTLWVSGGVMRRDSAVLAPLRLFDTLLVASGSKPATGTFLSLRGRIYEEGYADVRLVRWDTAGIYRPRMEARTEVGIQTHWLRRFPSRSFGLKGAVVHEYRTGGLFPTLSGPETVLVDANEARSLNTLLEIRILSAVITWQNRNMLGSYDTFVPGFLVPRRQNLYGVRWDFYN